MLFPKTSLNQRFTVLLLVLMCSTYFPILFLCNIRRILKNHVTKIFKKTVLVIPTALQYTLLLNINRSEKWGKIQTDGYNVACTVLRFCHYQVISKLSGRKLRLFMVLLENLSFNILKFLILQMWLQNDTMQMFPFLNIL